MTTAGFKGAHNVRNGDLGGAVRKAALIESGGYMFTEHDKLCIKGYNDLGNLGGAASQAAPIESRGYMVNEHDKLCITGYHDLGSLGGAASKAALIESGGYMVNEHGVRCIKGYTTWAICAQKFTKPMHWVSIIHISAYLFYAKGVRQSNGRMVTL